MKLEFKENMYIRTCNGRIAKIEEIANDIAFCDNWLYQTFDAYIDFIHLADEIVDEITKASFNIIDILEEGDYVNGKKIIKVIPEDICGDEILDNQHIFSIDGEIFENEIKSIVTKEQFEQMSYKIEE